MPKWTPEQEQAIRARNHTILVSAAAGSGKTAVLVERIVSLVREGARLNRMLIVTFTKAAAGEMRQRLNERLMREAQTDPDRMGQALDDLEGTDISTIHAFCQRVIRTDFQAVGIAPTARVCDEQQRKNIFEEAYREALNDLLDKPQPDADLLALVDSFSQKDIASMTEELYSFLMSMPKPFDWLDGKIDEYDHVEHIQDQRWYHVIMDMVRLEVKGTEEYMRVLSDMFMDADADQVLHGTYEKDAQVIESLTAAAEGTDEEMLAALKGASLPTAKSGRKLTEAQAAWKDRYYKIRSELKDTLKNCRDMAEIDEGKSIHDMKRITSCLRGLALLVRRVHACFIVKKNQQSVIDFSDMEQMTLEILSDEGFRTELQGEYDHIFVDECQDVSAVQDAIVQYIHGPNSCLFMVGDVKQSIYRFRLADPTLFLHRMRTFSDSEDAEERRIFLQKNFRSRGNVLDATNRVFRSAMKRNVTELDYLPEDELVPGRETQDDPPVEIRLVACKENGRSGEAALAGETAVVVRRIKELLETKFQDGDGERTYQYRDMVILLAKAAGVGARLAELLEEAGVPVYFDGKDDYFGLPEIRTAKALMTVLDNPMQDVPLMTVLKMVPFSMTESELAQVRICRSGRDVMFYDAFEAACESNEPIGERCRKIREVMADWRFRRETMRLSEFVWYVIRESGYYAACGAFPEGELRQANLRLFCQKAAEYEQNFDGTLSGFLRMLDYQIQTSDSRSAKVLGENENLVRIMTMHKSKGLEFPVVFCMRLTADLAGPSIAKLKLHNKLGVCLPYVNPELSIKRDHKASIAFRHQHRLDEMAERCRLLYVAMTRARERLILTGCSEEEQQVVWTMPRGEYRVWHVRSMMDWIMQAATEDMMLTGMGENGGQTPWLYVREESIEAQKQNREQDQGDAVNWVHQVVTAPAEQGRLDWWAHLGEQKQSQPIKTSVTSLARHQVLADPMPMTEDEETLDDKRAAEEIVAPLKLSELPSKPAFMQEKQVTGAERGTLMHHVLSLIPLEQMKGKTGDELAAIIRTAIDELIDMDCITKDEQRLLNERQLTDWFGSELGQRMLGSEQVRREWSFNLRISRKEMTLLQGIIDCVFMENGRWVLVDYKTDHIVEEAAFVQRHQVQLNWYARALREITGREVGEMWLYSLGKGKAYPVPAVALPTMD